MRNQNEDKKEFQMEKNELDKIQTFEIEDGENNLLLYTRFLGLPVSNIKGTSEENIERKFFSYNTSIYSLDRLNFLLEEEKVIEYFAKLLSSIPLVGLDEFLFMELSDDIKSKIFEKLS